ncbi:DUF3768 domain-containing protein [Phenylobacterium sp.]|uniref:DUF3768 domain-containing protein n=1 Tax=Phenylobacterium sp. TaxID=1871053 RepID=UPI0011F46391|nr:DUF3768 domain-containing protein [Phenylobacterium sp.]THD60598.1 MAG: DUF3768 domain-containing protein [Phenylobacterium sp.]
MSNDSQDREHRAAVIAHLNDRLRLAPGPGWMITAALQAKGSVFVRQAVMAVGSFTDFPEGDDPYGERDFGAFDLARERLIWKIDYYDRHLRDASPDPADPGVTRRILTLMLASDY